ncbi:PAS domain-containing protein [Candidatus Daviesbacteria bacterium]|nr:PAS domain-containing protein [Candidatus Daviesbacteria bacterium]
MFKPTLKAKLILLIFLVSLTPLAIFQLTSLNTPLMWVFPISLAIIASLLCILILKPLSKIVEGAKIFGEGNLNYRLDIKSGDELEEVANSFNQLVEKLAREFQQLEGDKDAVSVERNKIDAVLSSIIDGIIALDFNKNVMFINTSAEELTGYSQQEVERKPLEQLIHLFSDSEEIFPKTYCQTSFNQPVKLVGKNGKKANINLSASSVQGSAQTNLGCILILHDLAKEEELEQMKLDFVSMASHELKTPLTSIIGYLSVFIGENKDKIAKSELDLLQKSLISSQQLLSLVQNILNVNKIEREQLSVAVQPLDYIPILAKAVADLQNQATQKNIVLTLHQSAAALPKVLADPIRISEVMTNLVANAINYTNAGGKVDVEVQISPTEVTTIIQDSGVGIPKEAIPHLFSKFFRVSNQTQQASKGTGLGLYITKSIITKLNGRIWVESEVGKGSKFSFTLPLQLHTSSLDSSKFVGQAIKTGQLNY